MRRLNPADLWIALFALGCFVAIGLLDYRHQVRQTESYDSFSSFDFGRGGYRAWYEMLHDEGVRVARMEQRPALVNGSVSTLIVANNAFDAALRAQLGQGLSVYAPGDVAGLERWVKAGGRLVWIVDQAISLGLSSKDVGVPLEASTLDLLLPPVAKSGPSKDAALSIAASPLTGGVHAVLGTSRLRIPFGADPRLAPVVADRAGTVVGFYPLGKGTVVIVTDETLFENARLTDADNARLAYNLAVFGQKPGDMVAFEEWSHGYQAGDTWWEILPRPFRIAFGIAAFALLLALVGATWRFGPAMPLPANDERTSSAYLTSVATLLERGNASRRAVKDLARLVLRSAARSAGLPESASATHIGLRFRGTDAGDRRAADLLALERIAGFEHPTHDELVRAAQLSLAIRKDLGDGLYHLAARRPASRRTA